MFRNFLNVNSLLLRHMLSTKMSNARIFLILYVELTMEKEKNP